MLCLINNGIDKLEVCVCINNSLIIENLFNYNFFYLILNMRFVVHLINYKLFNTIILNGGFMSTVYNFINYVV